MRRILFALLALSILWGCSSDTDLAYVKAAVKKIDRYALYATGQSWEAAKSEALSKTYSSREDAYAAVRELLKVAGGKHSGLMTPTLVAENDTTIWEMPSISDTAGVCLIRIPEFLGNKEQAKDYVNTLLEGIPQSMKGAVIDLRGNTGGNMYPMIAGVNMFIPDGDAITFRTRKRDNNLSISYITTLGGGERKPVLDCPVAVLSDSLTASSAEALLLCFRGLQNARTFGKPTAGYASANVVIPMADGSRLVITSGCDVARTGEEFCDDSIEPDVITDNAMQDALEWILSALDYN